MKELVNSTVRIAPGAKLPEEHEQKLQQLREKNDELQAEMQRLKDLIEDEEIVELERRISELQERLVTRKNELSIIQAEERVEMIKSELDALTQEIGDEIPDEFWGPDTFNKKKKAVSSADGKIILVKSTTTRKSIRLIDLVEKFPFKAQELQEEGAIKVTLKAAETKLNKSELEEVVEKNVTNKYELRIKT